MNYQLDCGLGVFTDTQEVWLPLWKPEFQFPEAFTLT